VVVADHSSFVGKVEEGEEAAAEELNKRVEDFTSKVKK
jgi:hypothetical protein